VDSRDLVSNEAEHGVLGALMKKPELCETVGAFLGSQDFYHQDNGALYAMILALHSKKVLPDPVTLADVRAELPSGDMTMVYAGEIWRNVASAANGVRYAKIVLERSRARCLFEAGRAIMELAGKSGKISEQIAEAQTMTMALTTHDERADTVQLWEAMVPVFDRMDDVRSGKADIGLDFGLSELDGIVKKLRPGNLAIIAGRPGTGKTVLGVTLAERIATKQGGSSLVFSLEMQSDELAKRTLSSMASVDQGLIDDGTICDDKEACLRMTAAIAKAKASDMRICDKGGLSFSRICSIARFEHRAKPLDVIVIDYLGLINSDQGSKHQNRNQEIGAFTRGLKALAKELQIPIVALAQLNRGIESRIDAKPKMSDLRDSGEIEQDADVIIFAHRDNRTDHGSKGLTEIDVAKCRHAQPGFCLLQFQGKYARFVLADQGAKEQYEKQKNAPKEQEKSSRDFLR
jgi:replicative DNA helicase